jgi:hypothetical protein
LKAPPFIKYRWWNRTRSQATINREGDHVMTCFTLDAEGTPKESSHPK